jgi:hypothetical protein
MAGPDPKKLADENKLLKEQLDLLKRRNQLQDDSFDMSASAVDS